ncbi:MAG: hypothetical protein AB2L14_16240 [Candidatus Xenobiia bacterium LiM19]
MKKLPRHIIIIYLVAIALAIQFYYLFLADIMKDKNYSSKFMKPSSISTASPTPGSNEGENAASKSLSLNDMIAGVLILEDDTYQSISEKQARVLLKMMKQVKKEREDTSLILKAIDRVFTRKQQEYRNSSRANANTGYIRESPEQAIDKMLKILEKN